MDLVTVTCASRENKSTLCAGGSARNGADVSLYASILCNVLRYGAVNDHGLTARVEFTLLNYSVGREKRNRIHGLHETLLK